MAHSVTVPTSTLERLKLILDDLESTDPDVFRNVLAGNGITEAEYDSLSKEVYDATTATTYTTRQGR